MTFRAIFIFVFVSLILDWLDGVIARKYNHIEVSDSIRGASLANLRDIYDTYTGGSI